MFGWIGKMFLFLVEYSVILAWILAVVVVSVYVSGLALFVALVVTVFVWMYNRMEKPSENHHD